MLKDYLSTHNISIYSLSKRSGISYSTLNDIVNCKVEIANVKSGILYSLAKVLEISMDENKTLREAHAIAEEIHDEIEAKFPNIKHIMIHVNPAD